MGLTPTEVPNWDGENISGFGFGSNFFGVTHGERNEVGIPDIPPPPTKFYLWTSWLEVTSSSTSFQRKASIIPSRCWAKLLLYITWCSDSGAWNPKKKSHGFLKTFFVWPPKNLSPQHFVSNSVMQQDLRGWTFDPARVTWGDRILDSHRSTWRGEVVKATSSLEDFVFVGIPQRPVVFCHLTRLFFKFFRFCNHPFLGYFQAFWVS